MSCSTSPPSLSTPDEEIAALKHQLQASQEQVAKASSKHCTKRPYMTRTHGRAICRLVSCYETILSIIGEADRRTLAEADGVSSGRRSLSPSSEDYDEIVHDRDCTFRAFNLLIKLVPCLTGLLKSPDLDALNAYAHELQEGANSAQTDDNARIKWELAFWINDKYNPQDRLDPRNCINRGLQHDVCGELLCPIDLDWSDPEVHTSIRNGTSDINVNGNYFLCCLYPDGHGDPENVEENFLRSQWLLLMFYTIFISPTVDEGHFSSGTSGKHPHHRKQKLNHWKPNVSTILNMDGKVTGRAIAYAAVILVFNLTDAMAWTESHNGFSFHGFYNFLVDFFEDTPDSTSKARVHMLLNWWNNQVFHDFVVLTTNSQASHQKLAAQRARRATS